MSVAQRSVVPAIGTKSGGPLNTISSAGIVLVTICGTLFASEGGGLALGSPISMSTPRDAIAARAIASMPGGAMNGTVQGRSSAGVCSHPS